MEIYNSEERGWDREWNQFDTSPTQSNKETRFLYVVNTTSFEKSVIKCVKILVEISKEANVQMESC